MSKLRASLVQGGIWLTISRLMVNLLGVISTFTLARLLLPQDFGVVANAWTILALISSIIDVPVGSALIHIREPTREHIDTAWTLGLLRGLLIASVLSALAAPAASFFEEPALRGIILVLGASVLLSCVASPTRSLVQRGLSFHLEFMIEVGSKLATVGVSIAVAWIYQSYWALVVGAIAGQVATVIIGYVMAPYLPRVSLARVKELWSFSAWLTLSQSMATMNWRFDQILIAKMLGRADLGIYSVGDNLAQMPTRETTQPLMKVLFPGFSAIGDGRGRLRDAYQRAQGMLTTLVLPIGVGVALVADPAIRLGMGEKWLPVAFVVQTLAAIYSLQTISSLAQPLALSQGTTRMIFARDVQLFVLRLPMIMTGLMLGGLEGVVLARVGTGSISVLFNMRVVRSLIGLSLLQQLQANMRPVLSAVTMVIMVLCLRPIWEGSSTLPGLVLDILLTGVTGALAYALSLVALWALNGSPDGAEREALQMMGSVLNKSRRYASALDRA